MDNKNIIFNHTLEQYNKRYRNRGYRLLKFTKKEVEDFDKLHHTEKGYLLKDRKWWLIKDTYYEIPKPIRYTWFRNLNGAVQAGICLLGAGVVATAVTVPLVLLNQNQTVEPSITIQGADFDKSASHIELNKQSTIKLKEQSGKTIKGVEYVKVGDKKLADTQYSYDESKKIVTIKAEAMTSTKIEIKVKTEEPAREVTKEEWIEVANTLYGTFSSATTVYDKTQISYVEYYDDDGQVYSGTPDKVEYDSTNRDFRIFAQGETTGFCFAGENATKGESLEGDLQEVENGGHFFKNSDGSLTYYADQEENAYFTKIEINKFGYITYSEKREYNKTYIAKATYNGAPHAKVEVDDLIIDTSNVVENKEWHNLDLTGIKVSAHYTDGTTKELQKSDVTFDTAEGEDIGKIKEDNTFAIDAYYGDVEKEFTINVTPLTKYQIAWSKKVNFGTGYEDISPYELAKDNATTIIFDFTENYKDAVKDLTIKADIGETTNDKITAYFDGSSYTFYVLSDGKICFNDTDSPFYDDGDLGNIFYYFEYAESIILNNFDTTEMTSLNCMFEDCYAVENLDLKRFNTSSVTDMYAMFYYCSELDAVNVSSFDTSKVKTMKYMFDECGSLSSLNLSNFNTSNVEDMHDMFCATNIDILDLSTFDTRKVTDMGYMFCDGNFYTIFASDNFKTNLVNDSYKMFDECENLVGGHGTEFYDSYTDKSYARIDDPDTSNYGYFTGVFDLDYSEEAKTYSCEVDRLGYQDIKCRLTLEKGKPVNAFYVTDNDEKCSLYSSYFRVYINGDDKTDLFEYDSNEKVIKMKDNKKIYKKGTKVDFEVASPNTYYDVTASAVCL